MEGQRSGGAEIQRDRRPLRARGRRAAAKPCRRAVQDHRLCGASRGSLAKSQSRKVQPFARAVAESAHTALERTRAVRGACLRRRGAAQPSRWLRERGGRAYPGRPRATGHSGRHAGRERSGVRRFVALPGDCGWSASVRIAPGARSEEHTSELQSLTNLVCRLLLEKKKKQNKS